MIAHVMLSEVTPHRSEATGAGERSRSTSQPKKNLKLSDVLRLRSPSLRLGVASLSMTCEKMKYSLLINSLKPMCPEEITLSLNEILWEMLSSQSIKIAE